MTHERDIIIIGCGAGGGTAAQFARKTDRKSCITVFEEGKYPQYSKCGLPYVISHDIPHFSDLIEFSKDWFKQEHIDLLLNTKVEKIDPKKKIVLAKKNNQTIEKPYTSLILATGAQPIIPPIKNLTRGGTLVNGVSALRTLEDAKHLSKEIKGKKHATIIGAGLIGLEMADSLVKEGMKVAIVEALPTILATTLDDDMSNLLLKQLPKEITIFTSHLATKIENTNGTIEKVVIQDNDTQEEKYIDTDLLVVATGCKPDVTLAQTIGCQIGTTGGIRVNEKTETTVNHVYAVGDCTEYQDFVTKKPALVGLGSIAVRQGIAAGVNAAGGTYTLPSGLLQTRTSTFFDVEIAAVGPTIHSIEPISVVSGKYSGSSLPDYYPGGEPITIKVLVHEQTGRVLSAQAVGKNAALRINTFACAILEEMTVDELRKLETAYAPPIAPTLDAITLACDVASLKRSRRH